MAQLGCSAATFTRSGTAGPLGGEPGTSPSDTLQLLLEVLRTRPCYGTGGGGSSGGGGAGPHAQPGGHWTPGRLRRSTLTGGSNGGGLGTPGGSSSAGAAGVAVGGGLVLSRLGPEGGAAAARWPSCGGGPQGLPQEEEERLRLWLWRFMTALLRFSVGHPSVTPLGEHRGCGARVMQHLAKGGGSVGDGGALVCWPTIVQPWPHPWPHPCPYPRPQPRRCQGAGSGRRRTDRYAASATPRRRSICHRLLAAAAPAALALGPRPGALAATEAADTLA
jgi:hypothetical protein